MAAEIKTTIFRSIDSADDFKRCEQPTSYGNEVMICRRTAGYKVGKKYKCGQHAQADALVACLHASMEQASQ